MYVYLQNAGKALLMVALVFSRGGMHISIADNVHAAAAYIHMRNHSHQSVN